MQEIKKQTFATCSVLMSYLLTGGCKFLDYFLLFEFPANDFSLVIAGIMSTCSYTIHVQAAAENKLADKAVTFESNNCENLQLAASILIQPYIITNIWPNKRCNWIYGKKWWMMAEGEMTIFYLSSYQKYPKSRKRYYLDLRNFFLISFPSSSRDVAKTQHL